MSGCVVVLFSFEEDLTQREVRLDFFIPEFGLARRIARLFFFVERDDLCVVPFRTVFIVQQILIGNGEIEMDSG